MSHNSKTKKLYPADQGNNTHQRRPAGGGITEQSLSHNRKNNQCKSCQAEGHSHKCRKGKAKGAKTAKQRRIEWLHDYVIYVDVSCANLIDELKAYRWRTDSAGNVLDVPEDANDHGIDALSYALGYEIFPGMSLSGSFEKLF